MPWKSLGGSLGREGDTITERSVRYERNVSTLDTRSIDPRTMGGGSLGREGDTVTERSVRYERNVSTLDTRSIDPRTMGGVGWLCQERLSV